nr:transposase [Evansella halocellulosilytica]
MLRPIRAKQVELEMVSIDQLVPDDHLLRKIDATIDFSFIYDKVKPYYSEDNGRPPIDPVMLFKMLFIGYLYGIRSERQLEKEIETNIAYRWFLGLSLTDSVPHHSTISFNRHKRFKETDFFKRYLMRPFFWLCSIVWLAGELYLLILPTLKPTQISGNSLRRRFKLKHACT